MTFTFNRVLIILAVALASAWLTEYLTRKFE